MKITMLTAVTGPELHLLNGVEYDLPDERAEELIDARYARAIAASPTDKREKATATKFETR